MPLKEPVVTITGKAIHFQMLKTPRPAVLMLKRFRFSLNEQLNGSFAWLGKEGCPRLWLLRAAKRSLFSTQLQPELK